jgi:hypothetical protein
MATFNRWLGANLDPGYLHEVSRKVAERRRQPDSVLTRKLTSTPNPEV